MPNRWPRYEPAHICRGPSFQVTRGSIWPAKSTGFVYRKSHCTSVVSGGGCCFGLLLLLVSCFGLGPWDRTRRQQEICCLFVPFKGACRQHLLRGYPIRDPRAVSAMTEAAEHVYATSLCGEHMSGSSR